MSAPADTGARRRRAVHGGRTLHRRARDRLAEGHRAEPEHSSRTASTRLSRSIGINMPVRLIALAEGALTGFTDEIFDVPHVVAARDLFIDVPGPETERLARAGTPLRHVPRRPVQGALARGDRRSLLQPALRDLAAVARSSTAPPRITSGAASARARRTTSTTAGSSSSATASTPSIPVLRTDDIGNVGTICCSDGEYPEAVRALAFNGAEVVYRPSEAVPMTQTGLDPGGTWLLQNRAHAHFNNVYMVCPNVGPVYVHPRDGAPVRHRERERPRRRLHGQRPRPHELRREHLRGRPDRHRGAAPLPDDEPELELDEGSPHRGVPWHVRRADPSSQPVARRRARAARGGRRGLPRQHRRLVERAR